MMYSCTTLAVPISGTHACGLDGESGGALCADEGERAAPVAPPSGDTCTSSMEGGGGGRGSSLMVSVSSAGGGGGGGGRSGEALRTGSGIAGFRIQGLLGGREGGGEGADSSEAGAGTWCDGAATCGAAPLLSARRCGFLGGRSGGWSSRELERRCWLDLDARMLKHETKTGQLFTRFHLCSSHTQRQRVVSLADQNILRYEAALQPAAASTPG